MPDDELELAEDEEVLELFEATVEVLELVEQGPQGPPGSVDMTDLLAEVDSAVHDYFVLHPQSFVYDQGTAIFHWVIVHPLDHRPAVVVTDSAGSEVVGEVNYPTDNTVTIDWNVPQEGRATLT